MTKPSVFWIGVAALVLAGNPAHQPAAQTAAPTFAVDPSWPTIPSKWQFGQVASVSVDASDHVWILQRPATLEPHEKGQAAPPVLEFDAAGNFLRAWGGPGAGYEWPASEHGIYVDHKGFVWIGGNGANDHQILKFTKEGKFVMQIGQAGQSRGNADTQNLNQPADAFVYAKTNELFVADGYGNRRIIVFDADTGKFKRMWGAFGNRPTDAAPNPAPADAEERGASQFVQPVHAARVSTDGLVYVSDRGGKRVQVFTTEGKYLNQVFIGRECHAPECGNGTTAASTAFSTDPRQRFLYVGNRSQAKVMVLDRATLRTLDAFGRWGSKPGEFGTLHHMASDSKGNLYVTEVTPLAPQNRRVQKFVFAAATAAQSGGIYVNHEKVDAALAKGGVLVAAPQVRVAGGHRDKPGALETQKATTILYVTGGEGVFAAGARSQRLTKGDLLVVPAGTPQAFTSVSPSISYYMVTVPTSLRSGLSRTPPGMSGLSRTPPGGASPSRTPPTTLAKAEVVYVDHDRVAAAIKKPATLADGPNLRVSGGYRTGPYAPADYRPAVEVHTNEADLFYVIEGRATQVLGGSVIGGKETGPGQIRGSTIEGGTPYHLGKGDVMWVPAGVPHWFPEIPEPLSYLLVKVFY